MSRALGLGEFIGHDTRGPAGTFLRGWRKRQPPAVNTWLHTRAPIIALWQHQWPRIHTYEDRDTGEAKREVWGGSWNCLETEDTLRVQYKRGDDGTRDFPPQLCPLCLLLEHVRSEVLAGRMPITKPLFEFKGDSDSRILTAGGITGLYGLDPMPDAFKKAMAAAKVRLSEAWKESAACKCNYLFRVVDNDNIDGGVQIAIETTLLGDKVKGVIRDCITKLGDVDGNPLKKPYCIRWEHKPAEREFNKKYHALDMPKIEMTEPVRQLIFDEAPPNVDAIIAPGNVASLRAALEHHALAKLPWDEIFGPAEEVAGPSGEVETLAPEEKEAEKVTPEQVMSAASTPKGLVDLVEKVAEGKAAVTGRQRKPKAAPAAPPPKKMIPCDACGKEMPEDAAKCEACGEEYEFPEVPAPAAAPPADAAASYVDPDDDDIPF